MRTIADLGGTTVERPGAFDKSELALMLVDAVPAVRTAIQAGTSGCSCSPSAPVINGPRRLHQLIRLRLPSLASQFSMQAIKC